MAQLARLQVPWQCEVAWSGARAPWTCHLQGSALSPLLLRGAPRARHCGEAALQALLELWGVSVVVLLAARVGCVGQVAAHVGCVDQGSWARHAPLQAGGRGTATCAQG